MGCLLAPLKPVVNLVPLQHCVGRLWLGYGASAPNPTYVF
jgi:hypothetical protein